MSASAQHWSRSDSSTDGFRGGEHTRLSASNRSSGVYLQVKFKDLIRREMGHDFAVIDTQRRDGQDFMVWTRWDGTRYVNQLLRTFPYTDASAKRIRCSDMSVHWQRRRDKITIRVPQHCLKRPTDRVRVGFYSAQKHFAVGSSDDWAPRQYTRYGRWLSMN